MPETLDKSTSNINQELAPGTKLLLVAGNGELPLLLAKSAIRQGIDLTVFALGKKIATNLKEIEKDAKFHKYTFLEILRMAAEAKSMGITKAVFIGKIPKFELFKNFNRLHHIILDFLAGLEDLRDDTIHRALVQKLKKDYNIDVVSQRQFLKEYFPAPQVFSRRKPTDSEREEIEFGMRMAKEIARLDIGQTVVVSKKSVVAVESIEGTDECIKRGRSLGKEITVCKVCKPDQDQRFDIPVVGLKTLKAAGKNSIVALEAGECFLLNKEEAIKYADKNNICLLAL